MFIIDLLVFLFWIGVIVALGSLVLYFVIGLAGMVLAFVVTVIAWVIEKVRGK